MIHKMHLNKGPFQKIYAGTKTIELRMYDEKRKKIKVGDIIEFSCVEDQELRMQVKVVGLYRAKSFKELFEVIPLTKCGYEKDDPDAHLHMERYPGYGAKNQKQLGVIGIEIKKV